MQTKIDTMTHAGHDLKSACADFEAACAAYESHRDTLHYESAAEAHTAKFKEECADLLIALCHAVQAQGEAMAEHLRKYHAPQPVPTK
jgi:hypothetical protein